MQLSGRPVNTRRQVDGVTSDSYGTMWWTGRSGSQWCISSPQTSTWTSACFLSDARCRNATLKKQRLTAVQPVIFHLRLTFHPSARVEARWEIQIFARQKWRNVRKRTCFKKKNKNKHCIILERSLKGRKNATLDGQHVKIDAWVSLEILGTDFPP